MQRIQSNNFSRNNDNGIKLIPIVLLFGFVLISCLIFLVLTTDNFEFLERPFLIPYVALTGVVLLAPMAYLYYRNQFKLYHPLVLPVLFYFLPAFFFGGIILILGLNEPYFMSFVQDQEFNLPYTLVIVNLGFIGLTAGFFMPFGGGVGRVVKGYLPELRWDDDKLIMPGIALLIFGFFNNILGFLFGVVGFQKIQEVGRYDGLVFMTTLLFLQASFMLWLVIFRRNVFDSKAIGTMILLVVTALAKVVVQGSRGALLQVILVVLLAFVFSGKLVKAKHALFTGFAIILALVIGMIYGTTFRQIKGTEEVTDSSRYFNDISRTFDTIGETDIPKILQQSFYSLSERLEAVSSLAVVVSSYEQLRPYEESYGIDNNIYKDTVTFFVPRLIWKDKPVASEPRRYSELYFNFGESSFTITPMGDLLRNFGLLGVPLGMFVLGFITRIFYSALVENQPFSYWRSIFYFMVVTSISYESFYGSIVPYMVKVGFMCTIAIIMTHFLIKKSSGIYQK